MKYPENAVKYRFRDTDDMTEDDYDIEGEDYRKLIDVCSQYCSVVSFDLYPEYADAQYLMQIHRHMIKRDNTYRRVVEEFGSYVTGSDTRYYTVCAEMCELLKKENNIFSWYWEQETPFHFENLTFYRDDETVFFESITHEGECYLYAKDTEDVSRIVSNEHWKKNPKPLEGDFYSLYLEAIEKLKETDYSLYLKAIEKLKKKD